jgi:hypothetical protein
MEELAEATIASDSRGPAPKKELLEVEVHEFLKEASADAA